MARIESQRRFVPALVAGLLAVAAAAFPPAAPVSGTAFAAPRVQEKLFFAMQIADEQGAVLAEPKLLGLGGVPLEMTLRDAGPLRAPTMSLRLQPATLRDGSYEISFELSVPGRVRNGKGTLRLRPGEEQVATVRYPGGHLEVQLAAFAVPSQEFDLYLEHGITGSQRPART